MRGTKATAIAKVVDKWEPRRHKHGEKNYGINETGTIRLHSGHRLFYKMLKKAYKKLTGKERATALQEDGKK